MQNKTGLKDKLPRLMQEITRKLGREMGPEEVLPLEDKNPPVPSVVLFLLGPMGNGNGPCLILNKRSAKVRQAGDLCCPGGGVSDRLDPVLGRLLRLPGSPLARWPYWSQWKNQWPEAANRLALYLGTALREAAEEMRLNPLGVRFLGPMKPQRLIMFNRSIHPMVAWVGGQRRFLPNWEVAQIVRIPLAQLLDADRYACYRLRMASENWRHVQDFPCFRLTAPGDGQILWGATYRMAVDFLEAVFGFVPPPLSSLPVVFGTMDSHYTTGRG